MKTSAECLDFIENKLLSTCRVESEEYEIYMSISMYLLHYVHNELKDFPDIEKLKRLTKIKSIDEVKQDYMNESGCSKEDADSIVYRTDDFLEAAMDGGFTNYDGFGRFHDGQKETNVDAFAFDIENIVKKYPYVLWFNK